ncbi:MAG: sugar phosphate isomerase/epimerase [Chloroflexota bacterium]|nr:sugar phosphate isomerase/epimerase [Chloroflexota bacterium]
MKLCISTACYRWMLDPHRRRDRPEHRNFGWPPAFLQAEDPPPLSVARHDWMLEKTHELGLEGFYMHAADVGDSQTVEDFGVRVREAGLIFNGGLTANWAATADEWDREYRERAIEHVALNARAGVTIATVTHLMAGIHHHFTTDPPVDEQIERAIRNFSTILPACRQHGVTLAFENHMDYRLSEVVAIVEGLDSEFARITLDTANPFLVLEDPLEGAVLAAPYTVAVHLKDFTVHPLTETWEPELHWAPVGRGDSPIAEILGLLHSEAPNPDQLLAHIEIAGLPQTDPDRWVRASVEHLRRHAADHFPSQAAA